ncbi:hypothetical protein [Fructobacillus ficulneus]|uniref:Aldehyde dehydrogenase family 8 member A1 n=1 Tax=Fructobacillus ficulneus TaxID=157463 RepID=A0A0K8MGX9_9LACO|nr:hypothetical protein [Fructobacillus ficulneus]GAO99816.1 aldehyde dehydrogenase family 8 member A1 [Fructobacillus ficulneus]
MLTKNAELLLKSFINNNFDPINPHVSYFSEGEIFSKSPIKGEKRTEIALSELTDAKYIEKMTAVYCITTSGSTYFDLKKDQF